MSDGEIGMAVMAAVSLVAGFLRGFTGFGGPAFILAILTLFYAPLTILGKILVVDLFSSGYLFFSCRKLIDWRRTVILVAATIVTMPFGHWLLLTADPIVMRRVIAAIILAASVVMLVGIRYKKPLGSVGMVVVGMIAGVAFGATYIALVAVCAILLGPYKKIDARTMIIAWSFPVAFTYGVISITSGATVLGDVVVAAPAAVLYFMGALIGARWFKGSAEESYRRIALFTLLLLSAVGLVK